MKRYTLYAFGEIMLVMIGILLALQVNNWNEDRKARKIESEYLVGLKEEFETNLIELKKNMDINEQVIEVARRFFDFTGPVVSPMKENHLENLMDSLLRNNVEYEPSPGVMEDLISSGNLNKLTNTDLRKQLSNWKSKLARARRQEETVLAYRSNIKDLLIEYGTLRRVLDNLIDLEPTRFENTNPEILKNRRLENNMSFFIISSISLGQGYYSELKSVNEEILKTIGDQLNEL